MEEHPPSDQEFFQTCTKSQEVSALNEEIERLRVQLFAANAANTNLITENEFLRTKCRKLRRKQRRVVGLETKKITIRDENLQKKLCIYKQKNMDLKKHVEDVKKNFEQCRNEFEQKEEKMETFEQIAMQEYCKHTFLKRIYMNLGRRAVELEKNARRLELDKDNLSTKLETMKKQAEKDKRVFNTKLNEMETNLKKKVEDMDEMHFILEMEVNRLHDEKSRMRDQIELLSEDSKRLAILEEKIQKRKWRMFSKKNKPKKEKLKTSNGEEHIKKENKKEEQQEKLSPPCKTSPLILHKDKAGCSKVSEEKVSKKKFSMRKLFKNFRHDRPSKDPNTSPTCSDEKLQLAA